ncbi:hypothetical protein [Vibrio parahaemolyticus]|uniref:hypothetical protein n=3 Tax=Vibrio parahaemolyticus TaxID=670 RepID=UPI000A39EDE3|nr:hypothetical protein [Vibrio parahaemolyticus]OUD25578.1 hypothetical protein BUN10_04375 [Vibrio parahaemolyticus]HCM1067909.1 hypothetical protein [Vibrio parahaemolyticus]HCM1083508.1 hypothetical protein [Vibrio parahaemolyticus]
MKREDDLDLTSTLLISLLFLLLGLSCIYFFYNDVINYVKYIYNKDEVIVISQGTLYGLFGSWIFISCFIFLITVFLNKRKLSHKKESLFVRVIISFSIITIVAPTALMFLTKEHLIRQGYSFSIDEDKSWLQDRVYIFKK